MVRKAAFQMSLGFIVAVVFAVILLSLSITWIQGLFGQIGTITHKTTDVAQQQLLQQLASSGKRVGIAAPAVTAWGKGETGSYALGIKNSDVDTNHVYYINVYLEAIGGDLSGTGETVQSLQSDVERWFTYPPAKDIAAGEREIVDITIKPLVDARPGIYTFTAAVCEKEAGGDTEDCHGTSPDAGYNTASSNLYGTATFTLEIKG